MTTALPEVWVIDDDRTIRWVLEKALDQAGMRVTTFESPAGVLDVLETTAPDAIVSDVRMPQTDGLTLLESIVARRPEIPVIIMTAFSDLESTVSAYRAGAFEYLPKPFDIDQAVALVERAVESARGSELPSPDDGLARSVAPEIVGASPAMQEVFRAIGRLSRSIVTVLITGESGTGKELVARALHRHSPRASGPFIALNMAAIPPDLLESELFGHERGAFTGAISQRIGRFEQADGGTLFLDEIGDMPAPLQTRLLRVLADGEFYRVGGRTPLRVHVRIIAATHQDLDARVRGGAFREDLYHRLNVIGVRLPSLRERRQDIPALLEHFLQRAAQELHAPRKRLHADVTRHLCALPWPGNVRQLENACRWLTVMPSADEVRRGDLSPELAAEPEVAPSDTPAWQAALTAWAQQYLTEGSGALMQTLTPRVERLMIDVALAHTGGRRQDAARLLGWGRNTLTRKLKELNLDRD